MSDKPALVSVITVAYNEETTIEKTILSVVTQNYSPIEYIIIDGGSTDVTVDIIRKYESHITYWISEKDEGIYDAMNKGLKYASGEWSIFMNSGDWFYDETVIEKYMIVLGPVGKQLADKVLAYLTKEGIMWVIKQVAGQYAKKQLGKYIPFVGQAVAACAGFAMTKTLGEYYIDNCFELAKEILEYEVMNNKDKM